MLRILYISRRRTAKADGRCFVVGTEVHTSCRLILEHAASSRLVSVHASERACRGPREAMHVGAMRDRALTSGGTGTSPVAASKGTKSSFVPRIRVEHRGFGVLSLSCCWHLSLTSFHGVIFKRLVTIFARKGSIFSDVSVGSRFVEARVEITTRGSPRYGRVASPSKDPYRQRDSLGHARRDRCLAAPFS